MDINYKRLIWQQLSIHYTIDNKCENSYEKLIPKVLINFTTELLYYNTSSTNNGMYLVV